jgi:hypothetical protein
VHPVEVMADNSAAPAGACIGGAQPGVPLRSTPG